MCEKRIQRKIQANTADNVDESNDLINQWYEKEEFDA